jgi:hypothetical protein
VAVDATGIRLIEGAGASVKVGVAFAGTEQVRPGRHRLADRMVFADIGDPDQFGKPSPTSWSGPTVGTASRP